MPLIDQWEILNHVLIVLNNTAYLKELARKKNENNLGLKKVKEDFVKDYFVFHER
jgi:hypothetical protein